MAGGESVSGERPVLRLETAPRRSLDIFDLVAEIGQSRLQGFDILGVGFRYGENRRELRTLLAGEQTLRSETRTLQRVDNLLTPVVVDGIAKFGLDRHSP